MALKVVIGLEMHCELKTPPRYFLNHVIPIVIYQIQQLQLLIWLSWNTTYS